MRSECKRAGVEVDLYVHAERAADWARRDGTVRSAAGVFVSWVRDEIRQRSAWKREAREQLARDRACTAGLMVEVLGIAVLEQPSPRLLADVLEILQRDAPGAVPIIEKLRRLGDTWPKAR